MLVLIGLCHGYNQTSRNVGENTYIDHNLLIEVETINRYGFPERKTEAVKLSKAMVEKGMQHVWDQIKGQQVSVPVFVNCWVSKANKAGYDLYLAGDGKPINLQLVQTAEKPAPAVRSAS
ncbi:DNA-binding protein [Pseudomonas sp. ENNP23]|uniref:DNA-binding protein n=1 Tax=Pseudomonas sp. ENNP23 TaxID=1535636 RepID=UPI00084BBE53|nr:DNA-binding protein [Pseudomonas sp. ENNP23]OEC59875.1 hypothetical protein A9G05_09010 [Pseudomonas sp. ENNP23]